MTIRRTQHYLLSAVIVSVCSLGLYALNMKPAAQTLADTPVSTLPGTATKTVPGSIKALSRETLVGHTLTIDLLDENVSVDIAKAWEKFEQDETLSQQLKYVSHIDVYAYYDHIQPNGMARLTLAYNADQLNAIPKVILPIETIQGHFRVETYDNKTQAEQAITEFWTKQSEQERAPLVVVEHYRLNLQGQVVNTELWVKY